jgi:hypothetical protein
MLQRMLVSCAAVRYAEGAEEVTSFCGSAGHRRWAACWRRGRQDGPLQAEPRP